MFIKDADGYYVEVNPYMEKLVGIAVSDLVGATDEKLFGAGAVHIA